MARYVEKMSEFILFDVCYKWNYNVISSYKISKTH